KTLRREELDSIPLLRVVAGGHHDAAGGLESADHQRRARRRYHAQFDDVADSRKQSRHKGLLNGRSGGARVAADHDAAAAKVRAEGHSDFGDKRWRERLVDDAADPGDAHHQAHRFTLPASRSRSSRISGGKYRPSSS